jgi:hypothetical protein
MRILLDHSAPYKLARHLEGHSVSTAEECGWDQLENGDLLAAEEEAGFDLLLTADKNMRYQQNFSGRKIALVVLGNSPWPVVRFHIAEILAAVNVATTRKLYGVEIPLPPKKPFTRL